MSQKKQMQYNKKKLSKLFGFFCCHMKPYCCRWLSTGIHSCSIKVQMTILIIFHDSILWPWEDRFFYQLYSFSLAYLSIAKNSQQSTVRSLKFCTTSCPPCCLPRLNFHWSRSDLNTLDDNFSVFPSCRTLTLTSWSPQCFHRSHLLVAASHKCPQVSLIPDDVRKRHWLFTLTAVGWFWQTHLWAWAPSGGTVPARLEGECKPR